MSRSASRIERLRASSQRCSSARRSDCAGSGYSAGSVFSRHPSTHRGPAPTGRPGGKRPRSGRSSSRRRWRGCRSGSRRAPGGTTRSPSAGGRSRRRGGGAAAAPSARSRAVRRAGRRGVPPAAFRDRYLDVPVDLSEATFVATATHLGQVPAMLRERMRVVALPGVHGGGEAGRRHRPPPTARARASRAGGGPRSA